MLEVLGGYQRGLGKLHPRDHEERAWFLERIRISGRSSVPRESSRYGRRTSLADAEPVGAPILMTRPVDPGVHA
ncbi:MAG: hypothetical protein QOD96_7754, partial [Pseudonocardiales bacterium]|nr:hypothetical protein [Pseudonocardiales bacterium]